MNSYLYDITAFAHSESYIVLLLFLRPLSGMIMERIHTDLEIKFSVFIEMIFDNVKITSYYVAGRMIFEYGSFTSAVRRFRLVVVDAESIQYVFVSENLGCNS